MASNEAIMDSDEASDSLFAGASADENTKGQQRLFLRLGLSFFFFGLINNVLYVIILSAALDLVSPSTPKGIIAFCNIAPSLIAKLGWPYLLKGRIRYLKRLVGCCLLSTLGMIIVAGFDSLEMRLLGISLASFSSGEYRLGELTFLQLSTTYQPSSVGGHSVGYFASGTGAAGLVGAFAWWELRSLGVRKGVGISSILPIIIPLTYTFLLPGQRDFISLPLPSISHSRVDLASEYTPLPTADGLAVVDDEESDVPANSLDRSIPDKSHIFALSAEDKWRLVKPLLLKYMLPLFCVYTLEYTINQGVAPTLVYPVPPPENHPIMSLLIHSIRDYYPLWQLVYQSTVFLSRSSISLGLPPLPARLLSLPAIVQLVILFALSLESGIGIIPEDSEGLAVGLIFLLISIEGVCGGLAYVNVFYRVNQEQHHRVQERGDDVDILRAEKIKQEREFQIGSIGFADALGILLASLLAMPTEIGLSLQQVQLKLMPSTAPSHKFSASNLGLPYAGEGNMERKRSYRVPPPPAPLNIPEPVDVRRSAQRPPSPLRNSYTPERMNDEGSEDGSDQEDDDASGNKSWSQRSHSPSPSITKFASNIAQRVGAFVGNNNSINSPNLPTNAEIEAEAERERERSRREAESIIRREEEERRMVEDGVIAMLETQVQSLPPPPARSQTMSSNPSSPSSSQKEKEGWFAVVKSKLTPTKEPLTPAQQIILETKTKDKEKKKTKDKEWPTTPSRKYSDPAFMKLANSSVSPEPITPPRPIGQNSPIMTPSPKRSVDSSRDGPPLYAQFNNQGTLDVPGTLLTIARRFEKLERWSVSHVRALEDRMGDVERWLVDKEKEKDSVPAPSTNSGKSSFHSNEGDLEDRDNDLSEIRDELVELQGRVGELGREMAKLMTAPLNLASGPARNAVVSHTSSAVPPTPTSVGPRSLPTVPASTTSRQTTTAPIRPKEASPPPSSHASSSVISTGSSRTRLPYPTGDYTSPPGAIPTKQDILSPTNSPPSSLTEATRKRPMSIAGLPSSNSSIFQSVQASSGLATPGLPQESTPVRALSPSSVSSKMSSPISQRQTNTSPTPRKRYTVALGAPITGLGATEQDEYDTRQRNAFSSSPVSTLDTSADDVDNYDSYEDGDSEARAIGHSRDDTIGKSDIRLVNPPAMPNDTLRRTNSSTISPKSSPGQTRIRAQSSYGPPSGYSMHSASPSPSASPTPIAPLRPRMRSRSIDPIGLGISAPNANGRFIDPLLARRQEQDAQSPMTPKTPKYERGKGKVPIGELVAFFDR